MPLPTSKPRKISCLKDDISLMSGNIVNPSEDHLLNDIAHKLLPNANIIRPKYLKMKIRDQYEAIDTLLWSVTQLLRQTEFCKEKYESQSINQPPSFPSWHNHNQSHRRHQQRHRGISKLN
jgi:hypothetical protein